MALEITKENRDEKKMGKPRSYVVKERLFVDVDGNIVPEDSPQAATLLSTPGKKMAYTQAERLGLVGKGNKSEPPDPELKEEPTMEEEPVADPAAAEVAQSAAKAESDTGQAIAAELVPDPSGAKQAAKAKNKGRRADGNK